MSENKAIQDFIERYAKTKNTYPTIYSSTHEALGIILEEFDELKQEIVIKEQDLDKIYLESLDLASAAFALAIFIDRKKEKKRNDKTV